MESTVCMASTVPEVIGSVVDPDLFGTEIICRIRKLGINFRSGSDKLQFSVTIIA